MALVTGWSKKIEPKGSDSDVADEIGPNEDCESVFDELMVELLQSPVFSPKLSTPVKWCGREDVSVFAENESVDGLNFFVSVSGEIKVLKLGLVVSVGSDCLSTGNCDVGALS